MGDQQHRNSHIDLEKANPARVMQGIAEHIVPPHMRGDDWDARWQAMADYCEQPAEITTPT